MFDDRRTIYLPIAVIHPHLLAELDHGNHVVFFRRATISSTHPYPLQSLHGTALCVFPIPFLKTHMGKWSCFVVYIMMLVYCVCHYFIFLSGCDGWYVISVGIYRKIIEFLFISWTICYQELRRYDADDKRTHYKGTRVETRCTKEHRGGETITSF